nr:uncharacterized protein LOC113710002 [Coffea arabica]
MTNLLAQVVQQQGQNPNPNPKNPGNHVESKNRALERFQKFVPLKFLGGPDPDVAERWLEKMVDIFAALHYTEERQVTFAVFQLEEVARSWWNVIWQKWEWEQTPWTWRAQSVAEYESQFTRLSKFAPELIVTEQQWIRRFIQGLNVEIQKDLAVAQINAFSEAVEKTQQVESARLQVRNFQAKKRGFPGSSQGRGIRVPLPSMDGKSEVEDRRAQVEGLSLGVARLGEAREEVSRKVRVRHPVDPVGIAKSQTTLRTTVGRRRESVCVAEVQAISLPPAQS